MVVGGTAVILHGVPRTTADLDLSDVDALRRLEGIAVSEPALTAPAPPPPSRGYFLRAFLRAAFSALRLSRLSRRSSARTRPGVFLVPGAV